MKKLILLALTAVMMAGCKEQNSDGTYTPNDCIVYTLDSCEYYGKLYIGNSNYLAHKGNCKYCAQRRKAELEELVKQLKK